MNSNLYIILEINNKLIEVDLVIWEGGGGFNWLILKCVKFSVG